MVEFISLFAGLLIGTTQVELTVAGEVAAVVLELDGAEVIRVTGQPWEASLDFGDELRPRRLTATAFDAAGAELDRTTRLINVYRPPAGVDYVLHRNSKGWLTKIELDWRGRGDARPGRFAVSVDGRAVEATDARDVWLPPLDPGVFHVIEIVVEYSDGLIALDRIGFGGEVLEADSARITPVIIDHSGDHSPALGSIRAQSQHRGEPVRVVGLERGDAEIVFVRDASAARAVAGLGPARQVSGALAGARDAQAARLIHAVPFEDDEWARLLDPSAASAPPERLDLIRLQVPLVSDHEGKFGLFWNLKQFEETVAAAGAWISDGVALAGARLANAPRRRAVVLVLGARSVDAASVLEAEEATSYLDAVGVPFRIWYLGKAEKAPLDWGKSVGVKGMRGLEEAFDGVRELLARQRIAWVEGVHLPAEIAIELR